MKTKIGNLIINSNVSLAPMAGVTDYVLRRLVRKFSKNCLITTEMISSEALVNESKRRHPKLINGEFQNMLVMRDMGQSPIAYQITGHKPEMMSQSAKLLEKYADIIDINMGCPVNKVVRGQDGCALMRNPELASDLVKAVKDSVNCPVSVKFRLGYTQDELNFAEFGVKMQEAGADFITIHGRTRSQLYSGEADWAKIKKLTNIVDIPVFANGDVKSVENAKECLELSGANGVAIGRGILGNLTLIPEIEHYFETGEMLKPLSFEDKIKLLREHLEEEIKLRGEDVGIKFSRKFYPYYINSLKNAAKYRASLVTDDNYDSIMKKLDLILDEACCYT